MKYIIPQLSLINIFTQDCKVNLDVEDPLFSDSDYETMQNLMMKNIDISKTGLTTASPSTTTAAGSYYFHWHRDSAITNYNLLLINNFDYEKVSEQLIDQANNALNLQTLTSPSGIDVRVEPKFKIPSGEVWDGAWCRPQIDGAALRAISLMKLADILMDAGKTDIMDNLKLITNSTDFNGGSIIQDLDYIYQHYNDLTCDVWEDLSSKEIFWVKFILRKAFVLGKEFMKKVKDEKRENEQTKVIEELTTQIDSFWDSQLNIITEDNNNRKIDSAVLIALNTASVPIYFEDSTSVDDYLHPSDKRVASTIKYMNYYFCDLYPINKQDTSNNVSGVLQGRYQGDTQDGGNPWIISTANVATLQQRLADWVLENQLSSETYNVQKSTIPTLNNVDINDKDKVSLAFQTAGDSMLRRVYQHVEGNKFHLAEQLDKNNGFSKNADDLTWSYSSVLTSLYMRKMIRQRNQQKVDLMFE